MASYTILDGIVAVREGEIIYSLEIPELEVSDVRSVVPVGQRYNFAIRKGLNPVFEDGSYSIDRLISPKDISVVRDVVMVEMVLLTRFHYNDRRPMNRFEPKRYCDYLIPVMFKNEEEYNQVINAFKFINEREMLHISSYYGDTRSLEKCLLEIFGQWKPDMRSRPIRRPLP